MSKAKDFTAERVIDRLQIQDVLYRWSRAIDRLDYDAIRTVFHPDAIDNHGAYNGGVDGLIAWIQERHKTIPFSMHSISNILIEFSAPDTAIVESYSFVVQRYPAGAGDSLGALTGAIEVKAGAAVDVMAYGRYVDRFERRNGEWRILRRTVVIDSMMLHEVSAKDPKLQAQWTGGRRDKDDCIFRERASLGLPC